MGQICTVKKPAESKVGQNQPRYSKDKKIPEHVREFTPVQRQYIAGLIQATRALGNILSKIYRLFERRKLVAISYFGKINIFDTKDQKQIREEIATNSLSAALRFSPCSQQLAFGGGNNSIRMYNLRTKTKESTSFRFHTELITCLFFSIDRVYLFSGGYDKKIAVWNMKKKQLQMVLDRHASVIRDLIYSELSNTIISAGQDCIRIWHPQIGTSISRFLREGVGNVFANRQIQNIGRNKQIIASKKSKINQKVWKSLYISIQDKITSTDGKQVLAIASYYNLNLFYIWNLTTGQYKWLRNRKMENPMNIQLSSDGWSLLSSTLYQQLQIEGATKYHFY